MTGPVLVVDDDPAIRETVRDVLEAQGYRVATAADGSEALARAAELQPGLILLDMRMSGMDGWQFAAALRERGFSSPVVVMTAAADANRWADEIDAAGAIAKPFAIADLVEAVERYSA